MVSIIMPVYNAQDFLHEAILSVLHQTYTEWELIIVDDLSTDDSLMIAQEFSAMDHRIQVFQLNENFGGPARPRNKGAELASGKFIAFLDADDVWFPDKLEKQLNFLLLNKKGFTSSAATFLNSSSVQINPRNLLSTIFHKKKKRESLYDLIKSNFVITSSVLMERKYLQQFDEDTRMIAVEDLCLWLEIFYKDEHIYLYQDEELIKYRILSNSISQRGIENRHQAKVYLCLFSFLLEKNLEKYVKTLKLSICKNKLLSMFIK